LNVTGLVQVWIYLGKGWQGLLGFG